jgi:hypothetical protein
LNYKKLIKINNSYEMQGGGEQGALLSGGEAPQREHLTLDSARRVMLRPVRPDEDVDELYTAGHPPGISTLPPSVLPCSLSPRLTFTFSQTCGS